VNIHVVPGIKGFPTKFTIVQEGIWEMNVLHMLSDVASVLAHFSTQSTFVCFWATSWVLLNVLRESFDNII